MLTCVFCNRRDMFSGQIRTPDMTVVNLVSDFQPVHAPDKTSVDSPPAKAARRYRQALKRKQNE